MGFDIFECGGFAEAGPVFVGAVFGFAAPGVVGAGDFGDFIGGELPVGAVDEGAHVAGIDKEGFAPAVSIAAFVVGCFGAGEEPEAGGYRGGVEELAGQGEHAVHQVGLDQPAADFSFAGGVAGHGPVGQDEAGDALGAQVVDEVLYPGVVGVAAVYVQGGAVFLFAHSARRGRAEGPARIVLDFGETPVFGVEGRIGEDEIGFEIFMAVVEEGIGPGDVGVDAANGEVHLGQAEGGVVGFLAVDGDIRLYALWRALAIALAVTITVAVGVGLDEAGGLHEHAAGPAAGVVHPAVVGFEHFHQHAHHALGGVELAAALAFLFGEPGEEVFIHPPEYVLLAALGIAQADGGDQVD